MINKIRAWQQSRKRTANSTIKIQRTGTVYIFQVSAMLRQEDIEILRRQIEQQISKGVVVIDSRAKLISVEPMYKAIYHTQRP